MSNVLLLRLAIQEIRYR